jgi:methyl-accepting chemotaxis protein
VQLPDPRTDASAKWIFEPLCIMGNTTPNQKIGGIVVQENRVVVHFGIFHRLILTLLAISLVPVFALWMAARDALVGEASRASRAHLELAAVVLKERVDAWTARGVDAITMLSVMPAFRKADPVQSRSLLKAVSGTQRWLYLWHLIGANGIDIARSDEQPMMSYIEREYFRDSFFGSKLGKAVVISKTNGKPAAAFSVPVKSDMNSNIGSLAIAGSLEEVTKAFADTKFGRSGIALLIDEDGKLIASPKEEFSGELKDYSKHPAYLAFKNGSPNPIRYRDGDRYVEAHVARSSIGWITVAQQDEDEGMDPVRAADRFAFLILGLAILAVFAAAWLLARSLAAPIQELTSVADQISRGALATTISATGRRDEIGALARSIERLSKSMTIAMERLRGH